MPGISIEEFLQRVRQALGRPDDAPDPEYVPLKLRRQHQRQKVVTIEARAEARRAELLSRLAQVAELNGWQVHRSSSSEDAVGPRRLPGS